MTRQWISQRNIQSTSLCISWITQKHELLKLVLHLKRSSSNTAGQFHENWNCPATNSRFIFKMAGSIEATVFVVREAPIFQMFKRWRGWVFRGHRLKMSKISFDEILFMHLPIDKKYIKKNYVQLFAQGSHFSSRKSSWFSLISLEYIIELFKWSESGSFN